MIWSDLIWSIGAGWMRDWMKLRTPANVHFTVEVLCRVKRKRRRKGKRKKMSNKQSLSFKFLFFRCVRVPNAQKFTVRLSKHYHCLRLTANAIQIGSIRNTHTPKEKHHQNQCGGGIWIRYINCASLFSAPQSSISKQPLSQTRRNSWCTTLHSLTHSLPLTFFVHWPQAKMHRKYSESTKSNLMNFLNIIRL